MRLATWNVNSLRVRLPHVRRWVEEAEPDVLCLQETKVADDDFPRMELQAMGFEHLAYMGEPAYNGVAILSRLPLEDVRKGFSEPPEDPQPRMISAIVAGIRVIDCYVPMGQAVGHKHFRYKLAWLSRLKQEARAAREQGPTIVCGDLNTALTDLDVWDPFEKDGQVLYHPAERDALNRVIRLGFVDTYRAHHPDGRDFSWWDYRQRAWMLNHGLRIDHVLVSDDLAGSVRDVQIHKRTRGWTEPSKPTDHAPVMIELERG